MFRLTILIFCSLSCLYQPIFCQCAAGLNGLGYGNPGNGIGNSNLGYGNPSFGYGNGIGMPGLNPVNMYGGVGNGDLRVGGELPVSGTTAVAGQVPVVGAVEFVGNMPAGGLITISGSCGCTGRPVF